MATVEARGLSGRQLVYNVHLLDRTGAPVPSRDGRYQMPYGGVGASRSFIAGPGDNTVHELSVSIPAGELHLRQRDLPATARAEVRLHDGRPLAATTCRVPIDRAQEAMPPLEAPAPDDRAWWFVAPPDPSPPILAGPYATAADAAQANPRARSRPMKVRAGDYLWFVPLRRTSGTGGELLAGPCLAAADAKRLAAIVAKALKDRRALLRVTLPQRLRLKTWLGEDAVAEAKAIARSRALLRALGLPVPPAASRPSRPTTRRHSQSMPQSSTQPVTKDERRGR